MKLSIIHLDDFSTYRPLYSESIVIIEGYGRTFNFDYGKWKTDPRPNMLLLGRWRHPGTGNTLVGGINLNYLNSDEVTQLRRSLSQILGSGSIRQLKNRYWEGMSLVPDIFQKAYRTYNLDDMAADAPGTLRTWGPSDDAAAGPPTSPEVPPEPEEPKGPPTPPSSKNPPTTGMSDAGDTESGKQDAKKSKTTDKIVSVPGELEEPDEKISPETKKEIERITGKEDLEEALNRLFA